MMSSESHPTRTASCGCEPAEWLPVAGGAALVVLALTKPSKLLGLGALVGGGYMLWRGIENGTIRIPPEVKEEFRAKAESLGQRAGLDSFGDVDEASDESFPASDPPARY